MVRKSKFILNHEDLELNTKKNLQSIETQEKQPIDTISGNVTKSTELLVEEEGEENERDQWNSQREFLLSCIASSVGLGNVWRFPYTAYENGGGAFLIPYLIVLVLIGKPLYFLELTVGQFSSKGQVQVWRCVPFFRGIGFGQAFSTFYLTTYINALMAICVFYFAACFQSVLPWTTCDEEWADLETCYVKGQNSTNSSFGLNATNITKQSAAEQYNLNYVLKQSDGIENLGKLDYRLSLCLLLSWSLLFFSLSRGVKSAGKISYITAIFPYLILITLLCLGATMDGAVEGIKYFVTPDWKKLGTIKVWYKACEQLFFSLGTGYGYLTVYSSYNPFRHNVYKDAMVISIIDTFTSLLAGFTIFSVVGALSHALQTPMKDVVKSGAGLAFIAYPQALSQISFVPQLWAALFFLMLFVLGMGSAVSHITGITSVIQEEFPKVKKWKIVLGICSCCYLFGLLYMNQGGQYILTLIDNYGTGFTTFLWAILEAIGLCWIYGLRSYLNDVSYMLGFKLGPFWKITWGFFLPAGLTVIFIYSIIDHQPLTMGKYKYPAWADSLGWAIAIIPIMQLPIWAIRCISKQEGTLVQKIRRSFLPDPSWGPASSKERQQWRQQKGNEGQEYGIF